MSKNAAASINTPKKMVTNVWIVSGKLNSGMRLTPKIKLSSAIVPRINSNKIVKMTISRGRDIILILALYFTSIEALVEYTLYLLVRIRI